jgi:diacylglycerol diphosphate phosphatase / phosphatidate phosphatase
MPSGHSTAAFAGFVFLSLYFNAQLKLLSSHNPAYWKMLLFMGPILGAILIAMVMTMDGFHHWWDVTVGGLIGTGCAFVAFRMTFASVWDFRFNHVLLPRTSSLFLRTPLEGAGALTFNHAPGASGQWPITREAGWGEMNDAANGAPFDALAAGGAGSMMGEAGAGRMGDNSSRLHGKGNAANTNTQSTNGLTYNAAEDVWTRTTQYSNPVS